MYCVFAVRSLCFTGKGCYRLENGKLMYGDAQVARERDITAKIEDDVTETKGAGSRKLHHHMSEQYSGISDSRAYSLLQTRFPNRPALKPVSAHDVQVRHQIDLMDMQPGEVYHNGAPFRYILTVTFSGWLVRPPRQPMNSSHRSSCGY